MLGIRPVTPGTVVVLAATVLLTLVTISTPIWKSIYFLEASYNVSGVSGTAKFGCFGYCVGSTCSSTTLGYSLNVDNLFDITGLAATAGVSNTIIKGLTYVLILHPIAAGFGLLATLCGLLSHIREVSISGFATCFASFGAFFALLAFGFDLALFLIAKKRIESASVGGTATLGNGLWMTLAGMLLLSFSGCFFGVGRCLIRNRKPAREASEKNKPQPDLAYGQALRGDAMNYKNQGYGQAPMYGNNNSNTTPVRFGNGTATGRDGNLPEFVDRDGEIIPLNEMYARDAEEERLRNQRGYDEDSEVASLVTGVGQGYGRRAGGGLPVSLNDADDASSFTTAGRAGFGAGQGVSAAAAGAGAAGAGAYLASNARAQRGYGNNAANRQGSLPSNVVPFEGMHDPPSTTSQPPLPLPMPVSTPTMTDRYGPAATDRYGTPFNDRYDAIPPVSQQQPYDAPNSNNAWNSSAAPIVGSESQSTMYHSAQDLRAPSAYHQQSYSSTDTPPYEHPTSAAYAPVVGKGSQQPRQNSHETQQSSYSASAPQRGYSSAETYSAGPSTSHIPTPASHQQQQQPGYYSQHRAPEPVQSQMTGQSAVPSYHTHSHGHDQGQYGYDNTQQQGYYDQASYDHSRR